jgi:hypothetical protein
MADRYVQGWSAENISEDQDIYMPIRCLACGQVHLVNPASGRMAGDSLARENTHERDQSKRRPPA